MAFGYNDVIVPADNIEVLLCTKRVALWFVLKNIFLKIYFC